ncbi:o-methyltransferase-like protein [Mollisia scopiformis]|uniref:O-methyltransferas-like protein n=1 Tax=Mollisia scopiformis TaxID=149040 RepID=A0A194XFJ6_MOLSC|nr:o-methyltransferase-like protein [Mollisia scopiformis]KUJ18938.1 o-methyltransferas-like protein [Mollisia scopiformis]
MSTNGELVASIEALLAEAKSYNEEQPDRVVRAKMLGMVEALHYRLESPAEAMFRQLTNYSETSAVRTLRQMGVLDKIPRQEPITAKQLAIVTGKNEEVLSRLMRILTSTGILKSHGADTFSHTPLSLAYLDTPEVEFWDLCVDEIAPVAYSLPGYMTTHKPDSILNPRLSPYSWANNSEGKVFYEVLLDHPDRLKRFNTAMTTQENALPVLGMFPFASLLDKSADHDRPFIVDVAGGKGQSLLQIKKELEAAGGDMGRGRVILQDRKAVLDAVPDEQLLGIEKMIIDFFEPQPVKNAQIYYLRRIMHNWQDAECLTILHNIASAMAPDSRLLIGEMVVPEKPEGVDKTVYWMDLCMLIIGGKERSQKEFSELLDSAGLRLVKIWRQMVGSQTVIECLLK